MKNVREPPQRPRVPQGPSAVDGTPPRSSRALALRIVAWVLGAIGVLALASTAVSFVLFGLVALTCSK
jgi:hypothetical protein